MGNQQASYGMEYDHNELGSFEESPIGQIALEKAKELFSLCDEEKKGFIIKRDMQRLSSELPGLTPDQLEEVFDSLDQDSNGYLTMDEFTKGFGAFLGLQVPDEELHSDEEHHVVEPLTGGALGDEHGNDPAVDESQFQLLLESIGASDVIKDRGMLKDIWCKLRSRNDDPEVIATFENFLTQVTGELKRNKEDFSALESALDQRTNVHDEEVKKLYEEMECQIRAEKERVLQQEKEKALKHQQEMERDLRERDQQLQELMAKHAEFEKRMSELNDMRALTEQENDRLQKEREAFSTEKERMEGQLEKTQKFLDDSKQQLDVLKKKTQEEKRERFKQSFKVSESIASEREDLVKQLDMLRTVNKQLKDEKDAKLSSGDRQASKVEGSAESDVEKSARTASRDDGAGENLGDVFGSAPAKRQSPRTQLKQIHDFDSSDVEVDDGFVPGSLAVPAPYLGHNSLASELHDYSGRYSQVNPATQRRVEPVGANDSSTYNGYNKSSTPFEGVDPNQPERVFKVVFVGDSGVGKTCFVHRFCQNKFKQTFAATIGVDFQVKSLVVDGRCIALQLWDTAGQERFRSITKQYFRKADGVVLMYDVTSELSFINLRNWIACVREGVDEGCVICLVGNKVDVYDCEESRVLKYKDGQRLADEFGALFYETSAQTGLYITECMTAMAMLLREKEDKDLERALRLDEHVVKKRGCCGGGAVKK